MYAKVDVKIIEQPARDSIRFRYKSDERTSGPIMGINSEATKHTFPTIEINTFDYSGPVIVIASFVTKNEPYKPHPHCLVGKKCTKGVCRIDFITNNDLSPKIITFDDLGIECARHVDIEHNLTERETLKVDPFKTGFSHKNKKKDINMHEVRLCFQIFLQSHVKKLPATPIVSDPIRNNLKSLPDLVIVEISDVSSPVNGGKKIMIFCDKVLKGDIEVRFFEKHDKNVVIFDVVVQPKIIHKQYGISFCTPKYKDLDINETVTVYVQLVRSSDDRRSEPIKFHYIPDDVVSNRLIKCKKRKIEKNRSFFQFLKSTENQNISYEKDMIIPLEKSSTLPSFHNSQLATLCSIHHISQVDQGQENRQICQISTNQPHSLSNNHHKQVQNGTINGKIVHESQQNCEFYQLNNSPSQPCCSNYFQQEENQQIHQESNNIPHPLYNEHQIDHIDEHFPQISCNQPKLMYNNHVQSIDQSQENYHMEMYREHPSSSNYFVKVGDSQQNYEMFQNCPNYDLPLNPNMQLRLPHDSHSEYLINPNLYEIPASLPILSSKTQPFIPQYEQALYPKPAEDWIDSQNLSTDQDCILL